VEWISDPPFATNRNFESPGVPGAFYLSNHLPKRQDFTIVNSRRAAKKTLARSNESVPSSDLLLGTTRFARRKKVSQASQNGAFKRTTTRADLLNAVYESCKGLSRAQARDIFEMALEEISQALVRGETVKLRSFGFLCGPAKRERIGRNPRTGLEVPIKPRRVLTFRPSPVLVASINGKNHAVGQELSN
jgi:integration host factor subunit alpha